MTYQKCQARSVDPVPWRGNDLLSFDVRPNTRKPLWRDPLLLGSFLIVGLLMAFQLGVIVLQPAWKASVTDWLRMSLAWLELLGLLLTSLWLSRTRRLESLAWWMISAGFLMYAIAQTFWGVGEQVIFPNSVPSPWWSDFFYLLQYPFFFLALALWPRALPRGQSVVTRVKMILDCLLVMTAVSALSWYFLLAPIYLQSSQSLPGEITTLAYPIGDLGVLFGLVLVLVYRRQAPRSVMALLIGAVTCLALADSWSASIALHATYLGGNPPDIFWMACYLLFPLAGLAQFRLAQCKTTSRGEQKLLPFYDSAPEGAIMDSLRFLLPFVVAVVAGGVIVVHAAVDSMRPSNPLIPFTVAFGLLILVIARQELTFLESVRWRREREAARTNELAALQRANQQMDTFLGIASHELKTPLSSIKLGMQMQQRRIKRLAHRTGDELGEFDPVLEGFALVEHQELRLERLVNDLLDVSRIQSDKLELRLEWIDLVSIARAAVEEQCQAIPNRTILFHLTAHLRVPMHVDAGRIEQVVTNFLTNALKYSPEDRPIEVGLDVDARQVRVWVRDEGPGLPPEEQERIWECFHRVKGIEVQSGTEIGLGLGLHICQTIIERHQGKVGVESMPGKGSTFWFTLPR